MSSAILSVVAGERVPTPARTIPSTNPARFRFAQGVLAVIVSVNKSTSGAEGHLLDVDDLRPGLHLTTLGADEPGKIELSADLLLAARTVVDDVWLAVSMGAIGNAGLGPEAVHATFTEVLNGARPGRASADQATVYAPVGLPWQDLALAWPVYQAALASGTVRTMDFLS